MRQLRPIVSALLVTSVGFGVFFAILMLLIFTTYGTSWQEEIWWLSYGSSPSLIASLTFALLLLFWWSIAIIANLAWSTTHTMRAEVWVIGGSQTLMAAIGVVLWLAWDSVEIENYHRYGNLPSDANLLERMISSRKPYARLSGFEYHSVLRPVYGVWELSSSQRPYPENAKFLALWRNEKYQFLDANYQLMESGKHQFHLWEGIGTTPNWESGSLYLYGDDGQNYYMDITQGPDSGDSFEFRLYAGTVIEDRIDQYYETTSEVRLKLINQRRVHSSHPVELSTHYPFYDESTRHQSIGNRINPDAIYP